MHPHVTPFPHQCFAQLSQFHAGFTPEGPFIEVGYPDYSGYPSFGAGFNAEGPYIDDEFPKWLFGSPFVGPGPFTW